MPLTSEQSALAKSLGFDLGKIDWTKVLQVVQFLISLLATHQDKKAALAAVGCPADVADCACECWNAGNLALQAAAKSFGCCHELCA